MENVYKKTLLSCVMILALAAGMEPQAAAPGASSTAAQAPATATAQSSEQKPAPVYESATVLKSITRLVVVDVVATDKNGAVIDLKQDEFNVLEDGKEQKIRVFNFQQPHALPAGSVA